MGALRSTTALAVATLTICLMVSTPNPLASPSRGRGVCSYPPTGCRNRPSTPSLVACFCAFGRPPARAPLLSRAHRAVAQESWGFCPAVQCPRFRAAGTSRTGGGLAQRGFMDAVGEALGIPSPQRIQKEAEARRERERAKREAAQAMEEEANQRPRYIPPEESPSGQKGGVRIEWEQRVRFESMKNGCGVRQNEILQETLQKGG